LDESIATLKFADNAKSVFVKINSNNIIANDLGLVQKLYKEINNLKEILNLRKKRGNFGEYETEIHKLKTENDKLKIFVLNKENIEKLISENKILKLELQKLKSNEFENISASVSKENFKESDYTDNSEGTKKFYEPLPLIKNKTPTSKFLISPTNNTSNLPTNSNFSNFSPKSNFLNFSPNSNFLSSSSINKSTAGVSLSSVSQRLKILEKMEKQTDNFLKMELDKIRDAKRKREEEKITKSIEVNFY
jgi:hypothetical protein